MSTTTRQIVRHVQRAIAQLEHDLDAEQLRWRLGKNAELAWDGGGLELVESYLVRVVETGEAKQQRYVLQGLSELGYVGGIGALLRQLDENQRERDDPPRSTTEVPSQPEADSDRVATADDVMLAYHGFVDRAVAALEVARFGDADRRAALGRFEGFRFCWLATRLDERIDQREHAVLREVAGHIAPNENLNEALNSLVQATTSLEAAIQQLAAKSLILRLVRSNVGVTAALHHSAITVMYSTLLVDTMSSLEREALMRFSSSLSDPGDVAEIRSSLIVSPRARAGLRRDDVFDELRRCYEAAVPWDLASR